MSDKKAERRERAGPLPGEWMASDGQGAGTWRLVMDCPCCGYRVDLCKHQHVDRADTWGCPDAQEKWEQLRGRE